MSLLVAMIAAAAACSAVAAAAPTEESGTARPGLEAKLEQARRALSEARIEDAQTGAREVLTALDEPERGEEPSALDRRGLRAGALDLIAQVQYTVGDEDRARETIGELLAADPSYRASGELVGGGYVDLVEEVRSERVSTLSLECRPVPCQWIEVDGLRRELGEDAQVALLSGTQRIVAGRRNFAPETFEAVELPPGEAVTLEVELTPVARDLLVSTSPPGVRVLVDGEEIGTTVAPPSPKPPGGEAVSLPLRVPALAPGRHQLSLEARCRRSVTRTVEVVLDAMDPAPLAVGPIELEPARGVVHLKWSRQSGSLSLDGAPVAPGRHEVCPGPHRVALRLAEQTAWFETVDVADRETVRLAPSPRPTLLIREADAKLLGERLAERWNVIRLAEERAAQLSEPVKRWAAADLSLPEPPAPRRDRDDELAERARRLAPEADRLVVWLASREGFRPGWRMVLIDLTSGRLEVVAWTGDEQDALAAARAGLEPPPLGQVPFAGFDAAARTDGRLVVGTVHPDGPAAVAGLEPGAVLAAIDGTALDGLDDLSARRRQWRPGQTAALRVVDGAGERAVEIPVAGTIAVPRPGELEQRAVLGELAHAQVAMELGQGVERAAGELYAGLALAVLGETEAAATALDRASLDEATDPSQDARGTGWTVLEAQLRALGEDTYAEEVAARRRALEAARFGGRDGPSLRWAGSGAE